MELIQKLARIQQELKAPKNLFNSFGKYKYRNAEGILEAFKPFEGKYSVCLTVGDEIVEVGGRVYVKATAILRDCDGSEQITNTAYAREDTDKKGMDGAQITGTASSYARKYALNGLFLLDDTKDADTDEHATEAAEKAKKAAQGGRVTAEQKLKITQELNRTRVSRKSFLASYKKSSIDDLTEEEARDGIARLSSFPTTKEATA